MAKCSKCGYNISQNAKFCDNCGAKAEVIATPTQGQNSLNNNNTQVMDYKQENSAGQGYAQNVQPFPVQTQTQGAFNQAMQAPVYGSQQNNMPANAYPPQTNPSNGYVQGGQFANTQQTSQPPMQGNYNAPHGQNQMPMQNNIPTHQQYTGVQPMQSNGSGGGNVATKQKSNKPIIFIGIAALLLIVLTIVLAVNLFSKDAFDDPNIGVWTADEITMMGLTMNPADIYPDGISLELKSSGKCTLTLDGDDYNADYEIDGTMFTIIDGGDEFSGTIDGNIITITNLLDLGLDIVFVKDGTTDDNSQGTGAAGAEIDESNLTGNYILSSMTTAGVTMNYDAIQQAEIEMTLEINGEDGTLVAYGSSSDVELDISAKTMLLQGVVMDYVIEGENIVATGENEGYEIVFVFTAEGSSIWDDTSGGGINATGFVPPGYGAEHTVPVETLTNPSDWYGILTITDYVGNDDLNGEYEVWGYLGTDDVAPYFELYIGGPWDDENSSVFLSFYIEQHDYTFFPIVGDGSWLHNAPLKEEDNTWFTPSLMSGILVYTSYEYDYDGESFTMSYEIAQIDDGTPATGTWNTDTYADTETEDAQENDTAPTPQPTPEPQTVAPSFTKDELRDVYLAISDLSIDEKFSLTHEEVLARYFNGINGNITNQTDTVTAYQWISIESETSLLNISFEKNEDGEYTYRSMSINNIDYE